MNKYLEMFVNKKDIDIINIDLSCTTPVDRFWILAILARKYYKMKSRGNTFVCLANLKRLSFMGSIIEKFNYIGIEHLDPKFSNYIGFSLDEDSALKSLKEINKIDEWSLGKTQLKNKYSILLWVFILFSIILVVILQLFTSTSLIWSVIVGASLIYFYSSAILGPRYAKESKQNAFNLDVEIEYDDELEQLIEYDSVIDEAFNDNFIIEVLKCKTNYELDEIIRKLPKK